MNSAPPSSRKLDRKLQTSNPTHRKGKKSLIGVLNSSA